VTILGPDLSSFQDGMDVTALPYPFVLAKCTEGTYYVDADYHGWRLQAEDAGKYFIAYHFISGEDPAAQARALAAHIGDPAIPVMLDWEPTALFRPTYAQLLAVADAITAAGMRVVLAYAPHWYWVTVNSPSLTGLADRDIALVSSAYGTGTDYPGDDALGWLPYGGLTPLLYQYTDHASVAGRSVDMNAFRGTLPELLTALGAHSMATIPPSIAHHFAGLDLSTDFPPGVEFTAETAAIWADARAEAAYRKAAENGAKLDQLLARPVADVDALAAALAPKLQAGMTAGVPAEQLAELVAHVSIQHFADALKAGSV